MKIQKTPIYICKDGIVIFSKNETRIMRHYQIFKAKRKTIREVEKDYLSDKRK